MSVKDCKLESHKSAFCHVVAHDDGVNLVSYETSVCQIVLSSDRTSGRVMCNGNYSMTTIKHIGWFTREFTGNNLYSEIRSALKAAEKKNKSGACIEYISVPLSFAEVDRCAKRIKWYKEQGTRFYRYSKSPDYEKLLYGYTNFSATNL